jgi:hypothetical protein
MKAASLFSRKKFLYLTGGSLLSVSFLRGQVTGSKAKAKDPLSPELVKDFVRKGHFDLEGVKTALDQEPGLLNATWDWGEGDFETALGGALSHGPARHSRISG